jgi:hypothetical protein
LLLGFIDYHWNIAIFFFGMLTEAQYIWFPSCTPEGTSAPEEGRFWIIFFLPFPGIVQYQSGINKQHEVLSIIDKNRSRSVQSGQFPRECLRNPAGLYLVIGVCVANSVSKKPQKRLF